MSAPSSSNDATAATAAAVSTANTVISAAPTDSGAASSSASSSSSSSASSSTTSLVTRTIALSRDQLVYIDAMRERYTLGSTIHKTLRCLVNYARNQDSSTQRFIFTTYRCRKCGIKFPKIDTPIELYEHQWAFLDTMKDEYKISDPEKNGKTLRILLDYTQEGRTKRGQTDAEKAVILDALEKEIFTIVRCNEPKCTHQH